MIYSRSTDGGRRGTGLFKTHTAFCLFIPDLLSRNAHWASRPNYYAMNSYSLTATTVIHSGILISSFVFYFVFVIKIVIYVCA